MLHKSIRWRIQAWYGFLLAAVVLALMVAFYSYESHQRFGDLDDQLRETSQYLLPRLSRFGPPRTEGGGGGRTDRTAPPHRAADRRGMEPDMDGLRDEFAPVIPRGVYYVGWSSDGEVTTKSANAPAGLSFPDPGDARSFFRTRDGQREFIVSMPRHEIVLTGTATASTMAALHRLAVLLGVIGVSIVAAGLAVGWWAAGRALQPINAISATAVSIAAGNLSKRINVAETDSELGQLATVLNRTFEKFEKMIEEQLRFTADASHELRTPIAVLITQIQLSLSRNRTPEEYKTTLETCERAAERMRVLVNQLIELARIDAGDASLVWEKCDLGRVARDAMEFIQPLAEKKNVTLIHSIDSVRAKADVMKLGQVLINLLNNAIHHNKEGIEVCLSVERKGDKAVVRVSDNGAGIAAEDLPHLFDRFYRVDKARARGKGNSGLGLAICKAIVEGHGGNIRAESEPGKGAAFIIEIPAARNAGELQTSKTQTPNTK